MYEVAEGCWQILVAVGDLEPLAYRLEALHDCLAQLALERGVAFAAEDPAGRKAMLVYRATPVLLIRASPAGRPLQSRHAKSGRQVHQLWRRDEEPVVVGGEIAARPTRLAPSCAVRVLSQLRIEPLVEIGYFRKDSAVSFGCSHHRVFFRILSISLQL